MECKEPDQPALFYANHTDGDNVSHIIFSSFGQFSISIFQTDKTSYPTFNYTALYDNIYNDSITFSGAKPINSFTLVVRSVIEFDDTKDEGTMNGSSATTRSHSLRQNFTRNNISLSDTDQPSFEYRTEEVSRENKNHF